MKKITLDITGMHCAMALQSHLGKETKNHVAAQMVRGEEVISR